MRTNLSNVKEIKALGHGQRVPEVIGRVLNVGRPYNRTERDKEFGWHRQIINLQGADGECIAATIYSDKMHLGSDNEGQVWRFRCLPSDVGPRGIEVNKWTPRGRPDEINFELKINNQADASRLPFLEQAPAEEQSHKEEASIEPQTSEPMPEKLPPKPDHNEVEELVMADITRRRDMGRKKYGTSMERTDVDLIGWLTHRYEEILDDAIYTRRIIRDLEDGRLVIVSADHLVELQERAGSVGSSFVGERAKDTKPLTHEEEQRIQAEELGTPMDEAPAAKGNPVEKPGRSSKNPQGSEPFKNQEPAKESKPEPEPQQPASKYEGSATQLADTAARIRYIAENLRYCYQDGVDDKLLRRGHDALRLMKQGHTKWSDVFNQITAVARANPQEEEIVEAAFAHIKADISKRQFNGGDVDDEYVCEAISKNPAGFGYVFNGMKKGKIPMQ